MKFLAALALMTASSLAFGQDLIDLNHFLSKGEFELNTKFSHARFDHKTFSPTVEGPRTYHKSDIIHSKLTYGIQNNLRIGLELGVQTSGEVKTEGVKTHSQGPSDLKLIGEYRLSDKDVYIDFFGGFLLSTERRTEANYRAGHSILNAGVAVGQKKNAHEWRMSGDLLYHFYEVGFDSRTNQYATFLLDSNYQYRANKKLALGAGFDWEYLGEKTTKSASSKEVQDTDSILALKGFAKYAVLENVILEAGYRLQLRYELDVADQTTKIREGSTCYVGATVKF